MLFLPIYANPSNKRYHKHHAMPSSQTWTLLQIHKHASLKYISCSFFSNQTTYPSLPYTRVLQTTSFTTTIILFQLTFPPLTCHLLFILALSHSSRFTIMLPSASLAIARSLTSCCHSYSTWFVYSFLPSRHPLFMQSALLLLTLLGFACFSFFGF